eukprot:m.274621 g.274621  ORF g.274621 m.274621 type:complete len:309 (+) comp16290_c0_seq21:504-1430(+)
MKNHQVYDSQMSSDASFWIKRADTWFSQHTGRTQLPVTVAKISTLEEVKKMFAESGNDTNITQIVMCGGLAGLLYSHATDQVGLKQRMLEVRRRHDIDMKSLLPPLYHEFCTGNEEDSLTKSGFRVFTYHDENYKPIWPLMCVNEFLEICDRRDCSSLIKYSLTKATLHCCMRCGLDLSSVQSKKFAWDQNMPKSGCGRQASIRNIKFPVFDLLLYVLTGKSASLKVGFQMKEGSETEGTKRPVPDGWTGIWFCGKPAESIVSKSNWKRLSLQDLKDFLPYSLQPLIPKHVQEVRPILSQFYLVTYGD